MKTLLANRIIAATAAAVALTFAAGAAQAQTSQLTRAQVRAELVQLQAAGYNSARGEDTTYPAQLQAAEQRVGQQQVAVRTVSDEQGYGGSVGGASASGTRHHHVTLENDGMKPVYFGQ
ncbi:DUF4148 domain-containing protein [Burkholderia gladioli]|uniref:DUF4148 domain-containing protein n=1 Tax=Burkholderia gladioli TaxID=28095 RepID=UPI00064B5237|nr:DUF4148 domain-containing protein [Burkholderia gladioli]